MRGIPENLIPRIRLDDTSLPLTFEEVEVSLKGLDISRCKPYMTPVLSLRGGNCFLLAPWIEDHDRDAFPHLCWFHEDEFSRSTGINLSARDTHKEVIAIQRATMAMILKAWREINDI